MSSSRRSKSKPFRKNVLYEVSRKSNLNRTLSLKVCDESFTIVPPINCSVQSCKRALLWSSNSARARYYF